MMTNSSGETYYKVIFYTFAPIYVWARNEEEAKVKAQYQRIEEGLSLGIAQVLFA